MKIFACVSKEVAKYAAPNGHTLPIVFRVLLILLISEKYILLNIAFIKPY